VTEQELPRDPDLDYVPSDLRLLAGLGGGRVTVLDEDGISASDVLVLVPSVFRRAALGPEEGES
jgi:hypothetical protein